MASILIALGVLIWIATAIGISLGIVAFHRGRKDLYLAGRLDQQDYLHAIERGAIIGGDLDDPRQVFAQQLSERGVLLDLHRVHVEEWDGLDRLGALIDTRTASSD